MAVCSSKFFRNLFHWSWLMSVYALGSCLRMILCHLRQHSLWTAPIVAFSWLFVKTDGSPHCKSCWHLTPSSWNCVNMDSRTFVALHYNYVHVQFFQGWPCFRTYQCLRMLQYWDWIFYFSMYWHFYKSLRVVQPIMPPVQSFCQQLGNQTPGIYFNIFDQQSRKYLPFKLSKRLDWHGFNTDVNIFSNKKFLTKLVHTFHH